ncbi:hypothetical protein FB451DRAFT_275872 [Mycena latifolia]|nr:hypothetical protein FB451DRAFT_275872 [Mycena latifolia]
MTRLGGRMLRWRAAAAALAPYCAPDVRCPPARTDASSRLRLGDLGRPPSIRYTRSTQKCFASPPPPPQTPNPAQTRTQNPTTPIRSCPRQLTVPPAVPPSPSISRVLSLSGCQNSATLAQRVQVPGGETPLTAPSPEPV